METSNHQPEDVNITYIPHDFKVACKLFNLPIRGLLQLFIDHVSFYDAVCRTKVDPYNLASRTLMKYHAEQKRKDAPLDIPKLGISAENIPKSVELIRSVTSLSLHSRLNDMQRRKRAKPISTKLYTYFGNAVVKATKLYLNEEETLVLTPDFCLLCEIEQIHPIEHLTNFMKQISMPDMEARAGLNKGVENPALGLYIRVREGYGRLNPGNLPHRDILTGFIDAMQELHLSLFIHRSLDYRTERYRELIDHYYHKIIERN